LPALVFASQSPYTGWQNVAYSRNVMRNKSLKYTENAAIHGGVKKIFFENIID
jgi:hypothetical protein